MLYIASKSLSINDLVFWKTLFLNIEVLVSDPGRHTPRTSGEGAQGVVSDLLIILLFKNKELKGNYIQ